MLADLGTAGFAGQKHALAGCFQPVREDPDLAEILAAVEIDSVIPLSAFIAVAEILGYVYRANNQSIPDPSP